MPINDAFMLPKRVRTMEQMADLLQAEQTELTQMQRTIAALEQQLNISNYSKASSCFPGTRACSSFRSIPQRAWRRGGPRCWQS